MAAVFRIWNEATPSRKTARLLLDPTVTDTMRRLRRNGGPVRFWDFQRHRWGREIPLHKAGGQVRDRCAHNKIGQAERIKCSNGAVIQVREVQPAIDKPFDWNRLTPRAQGFFEVCATVDPEGDYLGGCVVRPASHDHSILSTHSFGEAIDWGRSSMAKGDAIKKALIAKYGNSVTVVWRTTNHFGHGHYEERPSRVHSLCA